MSRIALLLCLIPIAVISQQRDCLIKRYRAEVGVDEVGYNRGKRVEEYQRAAGAKPGDKYCAAFVTWCYKKCEGEVPFGPAYSPNWFPESRIIGRGGKYKVQPKPGDICGIYFRKYDRIAHTCIYDHEEGKYTITVDGNTGGEGNDNDGTEGVRYRKRLTSTITRISKWIND